VDQLGVERSQVEAQMHGQGRCHMLDSVPSVGCVGSSAPPQEVVWWGGHGAAMPAAVLGCRARPGAGMQPTADRAPGRLQVTIEYKHVSVATDALLGSAGLATVGNTLPNAIGSLLGVGVRHARLEVLKDLTGVIKPVRRLRMACGGLSRQQCCTQPPGAARLRISRLPRHLGACFGCGPLACMRTWHVHQPSSSAATACRVASRCCWDPRGRASPRSFAC
jgi:hypothetical protein